MFQRPSRFSRRTRQWLACWCLFIALPVGCVSTLLTAMLGPVHFHGAPALGSVANGPMEGWQDFRRLNHIADSGIRTHDHTKLGRHHHDASEPGLVVVGAGDHDEAADNALSGSGAALVLIASLDPSLAVLPLQAAATARSPAAPCSFNSCDLPRLDRPPIA